MANQEIDYNRLYYKRLSDCIPYLVDAEVGIIKSISELPRQGTMPNLFYYKATVSNTAIFNGLSNFGISGGTALYRHRALAKATGEAIERYCAGSYDESLFVFDSYLNLDQPALPPEQCRLYSDAQYKNADFHLQPFTVNSKIHWYQAVVMKTNQKILIPASLAYCPYQVDSEKGEESIFETISTGLAAHCSYEEAALNGILEVIERNNFMLTWLTRTSPVRLDMNSCNEEHKILLKKYQQCGYQVDVRYIAGNDQIASFLAVMRGTRSYNVPVILAAACHLDPSLAITKCLEELALMERFCNRKMLHPTSLALDAEFAKVISLTDHVMIWLNPSMWAYVDFLTENAQKIACNDIPNYCQGISKIDLDFVVDAIEQQGFTPIVADITTPDIEDLGIRVVRVIVPGFQPLNKSYHCRALATKSLMNHYKEKQIDSQFIADRVNEIPHPFA